MDSGESPQITRRTTRLSALAVSSSSDAGTHKKTTAQKLSLKDLVLGEEPLILDDLLSSFPGRRGQIIDVLRLLGPLGSPMLPIFVYGGASMGKTSVILQIFRHLKRPFVYASCCTCYSPRILFESILNQLMLHQRDEKHCYSRAKCCERPSDFANFLREALVNILDNLKGTSMKSSTRKISEYVKGNMIYLIIDNLELLRDWDKSSTILPFLFGLPGILKLPEVGIIFISKASPDTFYSNSGYMEPVPVYFPGYTEEELRQIFMQKQANPEVYSSFLKNVLKLFSRVSRRVNELSTDFSVLFEKYCEPLEEMVNVFGGDTKQKKQDVERKLFSHLEPHISPALNKIFRISSLDAEADDQKARGKGSSRKLGGRETIEEIDFHMSTSAMYLLLSAFLASRNPATLDASLFDSIGGLDNRKRKRKCFEKEMEHKATAEQELLIKGPGTFPLERLLANYQCIMSVAEIAADKEQQGNDSPGTESREDGLMSDVLLQLSSLCNANFIRKGGSCPLEGSTRYRCTISEELALKIARSLKFPLSKYLSRR
ncbi:Origin recognition complex subunit 5 [Ancistrocladus abbreviatus]